MQVEGGEARGAAQRPVDARGAGEQDDLRVGHQLAERAVELAVAQGVTA